MSCLFNSYDPYFKQPFGAVRAGQTVHLSLCIPEELGYVDPHLVLQKEGKYDVPVHYRMKFDGQTPHQNHFSVDVVLGDPGLYFYYFDLYTDFRRIVRGADNCGVVSWQEGESWQITVYEPDFQTPECIKGKVFYQIFPDRFCEGIENKPMPFPDRLYQADKHAEPFWQPNETGGHLNEDYFGGDLDGIRSKLDYLKDLGVTCIYLNPIFESHENHRYNTANYRNVDPLLGTNEDFRELCKAAKTRGISVILDGVFSHTGADSIYFNKFGRYPTPGAYQSEKSPYYSWYHFWGNKEYESWWGIDTLPNVDENNPSYTKYICGDDGVLDYWLSLGAAGYRLDVADELPDEFLDNLRACVKKFDEEKIVIGEVWEDASNKEAYGVKRRYLLGDQLDSVMNYPFREAIIAYMKGEAATTFRDRIMGILENYPKCTVDVLMNFVSTHDIERAINRFGGQPCDDKSKDWMASNELSPEEYERGKTLLKGAMVLQFFLPGVPSIYYGDEAGLQGWKDPFNRRCYPWGQEDTELIDYTRQLAKIRREHPAFAEGAMEFLVLEDNVVGFARYIPENGSSAVILLNRGGDTTMVSLRDKAFGRYAFSTVISGICDGDAVILPKNSYAVISAVRTNVPNAR